MVFVFVCIANLIIKAVLNLPTQRILRSSLAAVLLRMSSLRLPKIQHFPFIDKPLGRAITDGVQLLDELGAIEFDEAQAGDGKDINNSFKLTADW